MLADMSYVTSPVVVQVEEGIIFAKIPLSTLEEDYHIDFSALISGGRNSKADNVSQLMREDSENEDEPLGLKDDKERKRKRKRREEYEEYDLDDPFIDDDELPPGLTLAELLAGVDEEEVVKQNPEKVSKLSNKREFYVWKGPLIEENEDPLLEEKVPVKKRQKKKLDNKKKRPKPASDSEKSPNNKRKAPKKSAKKQKNEVEKEQVENKPRKEIVLDRIMAFGEDQPDVSVEATTDEKSNAALQSEIDVVGEEKVRKKFDISTPFLELEHKLATSQFKEEASKTLFPDPKKFPSNLRALCYQALVTCLRQSEQKSKLPESFFTNMVSVLPFPQSAFEKLIYNKLGPLYRDELSGKIIPELFEKLRVEISNLPSSSSCDEPKKKLRLNEKIRELVFEIIRCELDYQALDRLSKSYEGQKPEPFSEITIRKATYPRIAACWSEGEMTTVELGKDYSNYKRKSELKKLKEHGIEVTPILVPILSRPKSEEKLSKPIDLPTACETETPSTPSLPSEQPMEMEENNVATQ